jgi:hypothetical protein
VGRNPQEAWVRLLRALILSVIVLGTAASLLADAVDPGVIFKSGGTHSTMIDLENCPVDGCMVVLNGDGPITDGGGDFGIINGTGKNIFGLIFFIPTENFDQIFTASSNAFLNASIGLDHAEGLTTVAFVGTGTPVPPPPPPPALLPFISATPVGPLDIPCPECPPGFEDGTFATVEVLFEDTDTGAYNGLPSSCPTADNPNALCEGTLELQATVPEPLTFMLLFSAAGLLLGSRKLYARRDKGRL